MFSDARDKYNNKLGLSCAKLEVKAGISLFWGRTKILILNQQNLAK